MSAFTRKFRTNEAGIHRFEGRYRGQGRPFGGLAQSFSLAGGLGGAFQGTIFARAFAELPLGSYVRAYGVRMDNMLFKIGRNGIRNYRNRTHGLGRRRPNRLTPKGRVSNAYLRFETRKEVRPPYRRTGVLYKSVAFEVDQFKGSVVVGPPLLSGYARYSPKPVPQLLEEGGPASFHRRGRGGKGHWVKRVVYRRFPYVAYARKKTIEYALRLVRQEPW